ncbi:hypothetical protein AXF42_Ash019992 [Apostasia shenzhenica]|uniref:Uncharacterized protein n=1 Tax=Apostasia shenzhenica TaxID=1088818 RepID=A0A2H9ZSG2_9ASPA|nr:hypothetical protein AXF42_Ash019992 [Apostasia shenzhenica]
MVRIPRPYINVRVLTMRGADVNTWFQRCMTDIHVAPSGTNFLFKCFYSRRSQTSIKPRSCGFGQTSSTTIQDHP